MEIEIDPLDFSIAPGAGSGLRISFCPGNASPDIGATVNVDERVFSLLEHFFPDKLGSGSVYDRYGQSTFPMSDWTVAVSGLAEFTNGPMLDCREFSVEEWGEELSEEFNSNRSDFCRNSAEFAAGIKRLTDQWLGFSSIFIDGI